MKKYDKSIRIGVPHDRYEAMLEVCRRYREAAPANVVLPEPYFPYIPEKWNGFLVLAEAQNLANPDDDYVRNLLAESPEERMKRLYHYDDFVGVQPWDDKSIKLMLKSMIPEIQLNEVAVSNAVPWSYRKGGRTNVNPEQGAEKIAADFWREIVDAFPRDPKLIVYGNVAERVIQDSGSKRSYFKLRLPSPNACQRIGNMFNEGDLLQRYPEVADALKSLKMKEGKICGQVLFACHAVSLGKGRFKGNY